MESTTGGGPVHLRSRELRRGFVMRSANVVVLLASTCRIVFGREKERRVAVNASLSMTLNENDVRFGEVWSKDETA